MVWAFLGTAGTRLVSLAATVVLVRLLGPVEFGLLAFALVIIAYAETVGDLGAGMALIYWPGRRDDAAQVTFCVSLLMAVVWFALLQLTAPALAAFLGNPAGEPVLRVLAWVFPLKALGATHEALAKKDLGFKALLVPETAMAIGKAALAAGLALAGHGVWSLVFAHLAGLSLYSLLVWRVVPWRPGWRWPRGLLGPMLRYGRGLVAVNVLAAVVHHVDFVIVARMLGTATLGFYQVAYRIPEVTITMLMRTVSKVLFPVFSKVHARAHSLREPYLAALRYVSLFTVPAAMGILLLAEPLVRVLFTGAWAPAIPILRAIAVYTMLRALGTHAGDVLKATGRSGLLAGLGVAKAAVLVPVLILAGRQGAAAVAVALAGVTAFTMLLNLAVVCRLTGTSALAVLEALRPSLVGTGAMTAVLLVWFRLVWEPEAAWWLALSILLGVAVYGAAVALSAPEALALVRRSLSRKGAAGVAAPVEGEVS